MKFATYNGKKGIVTEEHQGPDGPQVTLATAEGEEPFVCRAPVSETTTPGFATFITEAEAAKAKTK